MAGIDAVSLRRTTSTPTPLATARVRSHGDWKLVGRYEQGVGLKEPELYNLEADLGESEDLAAREPERLQQLERILADYDAQMVAPLWGPDPRSRSTKTNVPLELLEQ
ncbi:MAG: hypothetical protein R2748_32915 [Bryobacterales bacterium]